MPAKSKRLFGVKRMIDLRAAIGRLAKRFKKARSSCGDFPRRFWASERTRIRDLAMPSYVDDSTPAYSRFFISGAKGGAI